MLVNEKLKAYCQNTMDNIRQTEISEWWKTIAIALLSLVTASSIGYLSLYKDMMPRQEAYELMNRQNANVMHLLGETTKAISKLERTLERIDQTLNLQSNVSVETRARVLALERSFHKAGPSLFAYPDE